MNELSLFIDESGHFDSSKQGYYLLTLVLHEQRHEVTRQIEILESSLVNLGLSAQHVFHSGAAIRGEESYRGLDVSFRRAVFTKFVAFAGKVNISYKHFVFRKKDFGDEFELQGALARELGMFLQENAAYFLSFDKVIAYYDNGQKEITKTLNLVFNAFFFNVDFRTVTPEDYRLFQAADLFCTLEFLKAKQRDNVLSRSDRYFFSTERTLRRDYLRKIERKRFGR